MEKSKKIDIDLKFDFLDMDFLDEIDSDGNTGIAFTFKVQFSSENKTRRSVHKSAE